MTVNKSLKKLYTKGELRLADTMGGEILIKKNPKGGWIVNWLDMVSYMNIKEYVQGSLVYDEPVNYSGVVIYPVRVKDYVAFMSISDIINIDKNRYH